MCDDDNNLKVNFVMGKMEDVVIFVLGDGELASFKSLDSHFLLWKWNCLH